MLVKLNTGDVMNFSSLTTIDPDKENLKLTYTLRNNTVFVETFATMTELEERIQAMYDYSAKEDSGGGGGTVILQSKSITLTENGLRTIVADAGYDGLREAKVTVDVPSDEIPDGELMYF